MKRFTLGAAFSDFVILGSASKSSKRGPVRTETVTGDWLWIGLVIAFGALFMRVIFLQAFEGGKYRILAEENRIKILTIPAPRGRILDQAGNPLADNPANSAVVGYVGEIDEQEVGLLKPNNKYVLKDKIGRAGLQKQYEDSLKGVNGARLGEVDNEGQIIRDLGEKKPIAGQDLITFIDANLQQIAYSALVGKKGAVIVSRPATGEIMALVSSPGYDPQQPTQYLSDSSLPFFNRAVGGLFPPGSTFKMVTALAALGSHKANKYYTVEDVGVISIAGFKYANWLFNQYGRTEGTVNWTMALARSNDIFFYKAGELVGPDTIASWAKVLGFGDTTGIDLPGEVAGLIPTPAWKEKVKNEQWFLGNTYHMAIGQGDVLTTPLQINQMTNILATNKKCRPHISTSPLEVCSNVQIPQDILDLIKQGMIGACSAGGTAFPFFDWNGPLVACKTGTSEYITAEGKYNTHALFTVYAPADNPQISVTVLVEGGGEGSRVAAPIARKILSAYFGVEDKLNYASLVGEGE